MAEAGVTLFTLWFHFLPVTRRMVASGDLHTDKLQLHHLGARRRWSGREKHMLPILAEGAQELGVDLSAEQLERFQTYYEVLTDWAERVSLTAVKDEEGIQKRHFLESIALIPVLEEEGLSLTDKSLIDIGSGAGIPGIPLKIVDPTIKLTLVEAKQRKAEFLSALLKELEIDDVVVIPRRSEETAHNPIHREQYNFAAAKALAPLSTLIELTLPFLVMGGVLIAPKGKDTDKEVAEADVALETLKGAIRHVGPIPLADNKQKVVLVDKDLPTPARFPRRPGMPAKRPL
ncbi:MAG: 16S rRNA (guanine(527)-N(7))-methyltransferase RsmG [Chloroflexi bacterium]|nr:16S rRNA (guanine(527)-N(7))-methyltransferase RsmG [Chloroflexota bacterium]